VISRNSYPECEELLLRGQCVPSLLGHMDRELPFKSSHKSLT